MAGNATDTTETGLLTLTTAGTAFTVTTPIKLRLVTALGSESAAGTAVSGGSYADQTLTFGAPVGGVAANTNAISIANMPACTVVGVEVWDSSGTPQRLYWSKSGEMTPVTFLGADTATIAVGAITISLD